MLIKLQWSKYTVSDKDYTTMYLIHESLIICTFFCIEGTHYNQTPDILTFRPATGYTYQETEIVSLSDDVVDYHKKYIINVINTSFVTPFRNPVYTTVVIRETDCK